MTKPDDYEIIRLLKRYTAYVTQSRIAILKVLAQSSMGVTVAHIIKHSSEPLDRITVYRSLKMLLKKGLIVVVPNSSGHLHYIISDYLGPRAEISKEIHLTYFICKKCRLTDLLDAEQPVPIVHKANYQINNSYTVFEGLCQLCK